jgi:hypothetical protein
MHGAKPLLGCAAALRDATWNDDRLNGAIRPDTLKRVFFAGLAAITVLTIWEHEAPLLDRHSPEWAQIVPFRAWPHIIAAAIALVAGSLQFAATIRRRSLKARVWVGKIYMSSVLIASALALYIAVAFKIVDNRWLIGSMAGLWLVTTGFAWLDARSHRIEQHRLWVMRSYALTLTFVSTRLVPDLLLKSMGYAGFSALYWVLIVVSLLLPDLILYAETAVKASRWSGRPGAASP